MVTIPLRSAYFYLEGGDLHPDKVTQLLGVAPDTVRIKGAINSRGRAYPQNSWSLIENGESNSDISELLDRLYGRIASIKDAIKALTGWRAGVMIVAYLTSNDAVGPGFEIGADFVALMNELDGRFAIDLYVLDENGD